MPPVFDFAPPAPLHTDLFQLEVLGAEHNERDYEAWTTSMEHIRATTGFETHSWPTPMSLADNLDDMLMHAREYEERTGFTYSILDGDEVIGCVYIYPTADGDEHDAHVRSWVRASRAELDAPVRTILTEWLTTAWSLRSIRY